MAMLIYSFRKEKFGNLTVLIAIVSLVCTAIGITLCVLTLRNDEEQSVTVKAGEDANLVANATRMLLKLVHDEVLVKYKMNADSFLKNTQKYESLVRRHFKEAGISNETLKELLHMYENSSTVKRIFHQRNRRQVLQYTNRGILYVGARGLSEVTFDQFFLNIIAAFLEAALC